MRVQYEEVVAAYEQGLQTQLRGFRPAHAFLETWVHDADPARSILSMVEAAELGGVKDLEVALGPGLAARIDRDQLVLTASKLGKTSLKEEDGGIVLQVSIPGGGTKAGPASPKAGKAAPKKVSGPTRHPSGPDGTSAASPAQYYDWALERFPAEAPSEFESPWPQVVKGCVLTSSAGGIALSALVDPETHRILHLAHDARSKGQPRDRALLNALCSVSRGYTIQDVSEHAVIRLESALRGQRPRPVPGVLQPENAAPALRTLLTLVRDLLKDYARKTGYEIQPNFEEGPVHQTSSEWGTSTVDERMRRITDTLITVRLDDSDVLEPFQVKSIAGPRVTIGLSHTMPADLQRRFLTQAELLLRAKVDPKIELFLDDKRDANAKRHERES